MKNKLFISFSSFVLLSGSLLPVTIAVAESTTNSQTETNLSQEDIRTVQEAGSSVGSEQSVEESSTVSKNGTGVENVNENTEQTEETPIAESGEPPLVEKAAGLLSDTQGISTTVTAPTTFKTYTDPVTGVKPDDLTVSVAVSIGQPDIEGATIELPYGFIPDTSNPIFKDFTMTAPIFSLVPPVAPSGTSIVESYEESPNKDKLLIHLKKTTTTVETLNLKFKFNPEYDGKIPVNQSVWPELTANTINKDGGVINTSVVSNIKSDTKDGMNAVLEYFNPINSAYTGGSIETRAKLSNGSNFYSLMNETVPADNRAYLEVPKGSTVANSYTNYYGITATTPEQDSSIPAGYVRYYRIITDDKSSFAQWNVLGDINNNQQTLDGAITPPETVAAGATFHIKIGILYKKWNAPIRDVSQQKDYTKQDIPEWSFFSPNTHSVSTSDAFSIVVIGKPASMSDATYVAGYRLPHAASMLNNGKRDIHNMALSLNQPNAGSARVNYGRIQVNSNILTGATQGIVRVELVIKNAVTGESRVVAGGQGETVIVSLPALSKNEFIDNIRAIPMGIDGKTEGALPPGNGLGIIYQAKNWSTNMWPDGTDVSTEIISPVTMGWTLTYDNEKNGSAPTPTTQKGNNMNTYYAPSQATRARAQLVSSQASARTPGDMVSYSIQGYNDSNAVGEWVNPEIGVAVPKVLELQDPNEYKTFIDKVQNATHNDAVKVTLVSSDETYNYYKFNASATSSKNGLSVSFEIPLTFKVANGALSGNYPIPFTTTSSTVQPFVQFNLSTNNLDLATATRLGYKNEDSKTYSAFSTGNTALTIASSSKLNGETAGRKNTTGTWSNLTNFAIENGGNPQMRASISNTGNTEFESVRLYNILPSKEDGRGSTGDISFAGLESMGSGTVYYTIKAVNDLPKYGVNLQEWTPATLTSHGFTTIKPANAATITAIYIDFGATVIAPNTNLDTILNFKVPDTGNQTAFNQFQYSAKEQKTAVTLNAQSQLVTFSTAVAQVNYNEALPAKLPTGITHATNIPDAQSELIELDGSSSITLSSAVPTLPGYAFEHWVDQSDSKITYNPGDTINFTKTSATTVQLKTAWKAVKLSVVYNENFGTTPKTTDLSYSFGDAIDTSKVTVSKRTGYEFLGWSLSKTASTADFKDGTLVDFLTNQTVYAVWKASTYSVKFDANTGKGNMTDQSLTYDVAANLLANSFTKEGYSFKGWATAADGKVVYADKAEIKNLASTGNVTLYAVWTANDYAVKFDANTGKGTMADQALTYDKAANLLANSFTKEGYSFKGWATAADGKVVYADNVEVKNLASTGTVTLYAVWAANDYAVKFDANTGKGTMTDQALTYDKAANLTTNNFTKEGYAFQGWATAADGKVVYADKAEAKNIGTTGTITLYAVWEANDYAVKFDANTGKGTMANQALTYDKAANLPVNSFTKEGYSFQGWATAADGKVVYADKAEVKNLATTGTVTLYAVWTANDYAVKFDANTGKGTMASQALTYDKAANLSTNTFTKEGYAFQGWATAADGKVVYADKAEVKNLASTGATTLYAKWEAGNNVITFNANGGETTQTAITAATDKEVDLSGVTEATRTGYTFQGWFDSSDNKLPATVTMPAGGLAYTAKWKVNNHTVAFDANKGTGSMNPQGFIYDEPQALTENQFTRNGYTFAGWNTKADGSGHTYTNKQTVSNLSAKADETITLYAQWVAGDNVITFNANGGETTQTTITAVTDKEVDLSGVTEATRTGYTFQGWFDSSDNKLPATVTMPAGGLAYTAKWKVNNHTVAFDANRGTGSMNPQGFIYDEPQALTENQFTRNGYTFGGWNNKADGSGHTYTNKQTVSNLSAKADETITLYAQWVAGDNVITFNANGGETTQTAITAATDKEVDLSGVTEAIRTGYTFQGWFDSSDKKLPTTVSMPAGGLAYTAKWKVNTHTVAFDANKGTGSMDPQGFSYDESQALTENQFTRNGYTFAGWNAKADGSGHTYTNKQIVSNLSAKADETITLYAQWIAGNNVIMFNANGGETTQTAITAATDKEVDLSGVTEAIRTGYTFLGWFDSSDKKLPTTVLMPAGGLTYTAKWKANNHIISFDSNKGTGSMDPQGFSYDEPQALTESQFTRNGYTFAGWNTKADGSGHTYTNKQTVSNLSAKADETITLYAQWAANGYDIKFDANTGEGTMDNQPMVYDVTATLTENTFVKEGYLFQGWATTPDGKAVYANQSEVNNLVTVGTVTLYAAWKKDQTSIEAKDSTLYVGDTWNKADNFTSATDEDGHAIQFTDVVVTEINQVDPTTVGSYKVTYAYNNKEKTITVNVVENQETLITKDLTIFEKEKWTAKDHFVSASKKDGTDVPFEDLTIDGDDKVNASKAGIYTFTVKNNKASNVVTLTVLKDQSTIKVKDTTITVGDKWAAADNFVSATDRYGHPIELTGLKVTENVSTDKAGKYKVVYTLMVQDVNEDKTRKTVSADVNEDETRESVSAEAYVTVLDKKKEEPTVKPTNKPTTKPTASGSTGKTTNSVATGAKRLPQTGEQIGKTGLLVGIVIVGLSGVFFLLKKKRKEN